MTTDLHNLIPQLAGQRIVVVGDVILDEYVIGRATRLSREAPVPVLEFEERRFIPGGAANPAANIVALGSQAVQVGLIGADSAADHLRAALQSRGIDTSALIPCEDRPTTQKSRIMAQMGLRFPQQVARVDTVSRQPIDANVQQQLMTQIDAHLSTADAVLLSDYRAGMLTPELVTQIRDKTVSVGKLLAADVQGNFDKYSGFGLVKCNADEAASYLRRTLKTQHDFAHAARELCEKLKLTRAMVITRGGDGATLAIRGGETVHCPAPAVSDVYDTVGAGDTAIAVMTLALTAGADYGDAATLANYASGIVVRHVGNYTPSPDELRAAVESR